MKSILKLQKLFFWICCYSITLFNFYATFAFFSEFNSRIYFTKTTVDYKQFIINILYQFDNLQNTIMIIYKKTNNYCTESQSHITGLM